MKRAEVGRQSHIGSDQTPAFEEQGIVATSKPTRTVRTYKFRLFTNRDQERELARCLETHRRLYNQALDGKMLCWENGARWSLAEQGRWLTIQRRLNPHLATINATSGGQTLRRLDRAFVSFYTRCKSGKIPGHPRFKGKDRFNSFSFRRSGGFADGWKVIGKKLRLHHIGTIRVKWHRQLPDGTIKAVTVSRDGDKWFVAFCVEQEATPSVAPVSKVGIDVGLKSFVTTSTGETLGDTSCFERALPELRRRQRALSRCNRGSNRRKIVKAGVAKLHAKVRNVRRDTHHKVSRSLVNRYGTIAAESLNIQGLLRNRRLARRIQDAAWHSFIQILIAKAASAGCKVVLVDPRNTSQECSACGRVVEKSLSERTHKCECGCELDRDYNAAINILGRAVPEGRNAGVALHVPKSRFVLHELK